MTAVRIGPQRPGGWLGFDLAEVMAAIGDWQDLEWVLSGAEFNGDVTEVWPPGTVVDELTRQPGGLPLTWEQMRLLASSCQQIVDGTLIGYSRDGSPKLSLAAIDSSYWIVWSEDDAVLVRIRAAFAAVDDYDEPSPPPRR
jgi:hypothetical protein